MTQLANAYSLAQRWTGLVDPSEGDYVALAAGSTFNITGQYQMTQPFTWAAK